MLKSVLYSLLLLTTTVRLTDIIYLMTKDDTNLPALVFAVSAAMVVYGVVLIVKRILGNVTLKQLMTFYTAQTIMIAFNLIYVAAACPLKISLSETIAVGTFLDILVNCGVVYFCAKHMRSHYFEVAVPAVTANRNV